MRIRPLEVEAADGYKLTATLHEPDRRSRRSVVLIVGSAGVKQSYYGAFAQYLTGHGFVVITFDYRGIGKSRPERLGHFPARARDWGERDLNGVIDWIGRRFRRSAIIGIAHSHGGSMVGLAPNNRMISALMTVSAQNAYWGLWTGVARYFRFAWWSWVVPGLTFAVSYFPARRLGQGEDLPEGVALEWSMWCRNPNFIVDEQGRPMRKHFKSFKAPILALSFEDDRRHAPKRAVDELLSWFGSRHKERLHISPRDEGVDSIGHFGFFKLGPDSRIWQDSVRWLRQQAA